MPIRPDKIQGLTTSYGRPGFNQATVDFSNSTPFEIDLASDFTKPQSVVQVVIYSSVAFYWTYTEDDDATSRLSSDTTRFLLPAGFWTFDVMGAAGILAFLSADAASSTTDGLRYSSYFGS